MERPVSLYIKEPLSIRHYQSQSYYSNKQLKMHTRCLHCDVTEIRGQMRGSTVTGFLESRISDCTKVPWRITLIGRGMSFWNEADVLRCQHVLTGPVPCFPLFHPGPKGTWSPGPGPHIIDNHSIHTQETALLWDVDLTGDVCARACACFFSPVSLNILTFIKSSHQTPPPPPVHLHIWALQIAVNPRGGGGVNKEWADGVQRKYGMRDGLYRVGEAHGRAT